MSRDLALRSSAPRVDSSHASRRAAASGGHVLASPPGCGVSSSCCRCLVAVRSLVAVLLLPFALSILLPFAPARHSTPRISGPPHANSLPDCLQLAASRQSWRITRCPRNRTEFFKGGPAIEKVGPKALRQPGARLGADRCQRLDRAHVQASVRGAQHGHGQGRCCLRRSCPPLYAVCLLGHKQN